MNILGDMLCDNDLSQKRQFYSSKPLQFWILTYGRLQHAGRESCHGQFDEICVNGDASVV